MKKYKIEIEILRQKIYVTVESTSRVIAQTLAYERVKKCKKEITNIIEL